MQEKTARIVSAIFHPLFFPLYILLILTTNKVCFLIEIPLYYTLILFAIVLLTTVLFPLLITYLLFRKHIISSFLLQAKEERIYPILCAAAFYYVTYYLLKGSLISGFFGLYMLGATLLAIFALFTNFYHKVSLHMIGAGAFTGLFMGMTISYGINFLPFILVGILLSGLLGFARLKTQSHKPAEIYSGFLMGMFTMTLLIILL
jgi:hypothetical protein